MTSLHPLALRILAAAGASTATAALFAGGVFSTIEAGCCPPPTETGPYVASLGDTCTIELESSFEGLVERCELVNAEVCPPPEQVDAGTFKLVCGPLRPGVIVPNGPA